MTLPRIRGLLLGAALASAPGCGRPSTNPQPVLAAPAPAPAAVAARPAPARIPATGRLASLDPGAPAAPAPVRARPAPAPAARPPGKVEELPLYLPPPPPARPSREPMWKQRAKSY